MIKKPVLEAHNAYYDVTNCAKCYFALKGHQS